MNLQSKIGLLNQFILLLSFLVKIVFMWIQPLEIVWSVNQNLTVYKSLSIQFGKWCSSKVETLTVIDATDLKKDSLKNAIAVGNTSLKSIPLIGCLIPKELRKNGTLSIKFSNSWESINLSDLYEFINLILLRKI